MDTTIMIGPADLDAEPSLADVARDVASVLGHPLAPVPGDEMFQGGTDTSYAWLTREGSDEEPFRSHFIDLELSAPRERDESYANVLFDRLADLERYRLILVVDHGCVRSTHFPCEEW